MNPQVPDHDALSPRDRRWVEALRAQAPEGPPSSLDALILGEAVLAVARQQAERSPLRVAARARRPARWMAAVAGVMVVLSAGVLVRQVALETAPRPEPQFPASPPVAAPSPRSAAEDRADAVLRATREAEGLPAWETVEAAAPADAEVANAAGASAPEPGPAPIVGQARSESTRRAQAMEASPSASLPPPPPEAPAPERMAPAAAPPSPAPPAAKLAPKAARPLAESAPAPAAFSSAAAEPAAAAKSLPAEGRERAEAGLEAVASAEQEAGLPEPELLADVRRLLAVGERELARERLRAWRERHPDAVLPSELDALLDEQR